MCCNCGFVVCRKHQRTIISWARSCLTASKMPVATACSKHCGTSGDMLGCHANTRAIKNAASPHCTLWLQWPLSLVLHCYTRNIWQRVRLGRTGELGEEILVGFGAHKATTSTAMASTISWSKPGYSTPVLCSTPFTWTNGGRTGLPLIMFLYTHCMPCLRCHQRMHTTSDRLS